MSNLKIFGFCQTIKIPPKTTPKKRYKFFRWLWRFKANKAIMEARNTVEADARSLWQTKQRRLLLRRWPDSGAKNQNQHYGFRHDGVMLYPDRVTMCATPVVLNLSLPIFRQPSLAPMVIPPKKAEWGSGTTLAMADKTSLLGQTIFLSARNRCYRK